MAKSYYVILGISPNASAEQIKAAYRRLAKEYHPDRNEGGCDVFREIQEAYSVLGNARKRNEYGRQLSKRPFKEPVAPSSFAEPEPLIPEQRPVNFGDISPVRSFRSFSPSHDEIFDWLWNNLSSLNRQKSARIQNLTLEVALTREQALRGGNARVMVPARAICPTCAGVGGVGPYECSRCAGEGEISGEMPISIAFPAGVNKDHAVVIPLERFGIKNTHLTVLFRPAGGDRV